VQGTIKLYAKVYSKSIDRALKKIYYKETQNNFQKLNQISIDKKQGQLKNKENKTYITILCREDN